MVNGVSNMLKFISCGTTPMQALAASRSRSMSCPKTLACPLLLLTSDVTMPISVVLPAPLGPRSAKKSPCSTSRSTPFRAWTPFLYVLVRSRTERALILGVDIISTDTSVRKIALEILLVGALVAGFDRRLFRQRFACLRGRFREALLVRRIQ